MIKRAAYIICGLLLLCAVSAALCSLAVSSSAKGRTFDDIALLPQRPTALILGTSPRVAGRPNAYFTNRINAAAELYRAGKVKRFIISGDNRKANYNEPEAMRSALMQRGVPKGIIHLDYAGFRTLDSVVRAYEIFGQDSITIVSQKFHNERAIFIAGLKGIDAIGYNAEDVALAFGLKTRIREIFARIKVFIDLAVQKQPHFLGDKIDITM